MRTFQGVITTLLLLATIATPSADASPSSGAASDQSSTVAMTIRIYDAGALPPARRTRPLTVAHGILRAAGLDVSWLACETMLAGVDINPCVAPPSADELVVSFAERPVPTDHSGPVQLGYSVIDTDERAGTFATIYVDRARRFARDSGDSVDLVIGRAIAHEIGHLLLGTTNHASTGVMRATWSRPSLRPQLARDWLFDTGEAVTMREAIRARLHRVSPLQADVHRRAANR
jgi:hypothetical protein